MRLLCLSLFLWGGYCQNDCPENESLVCSSCESHCGFTSSTCETSECSTGCFCNEGFSRNSRTGACIANDECPQVSCAFTKIQMYLVGYGFDVSLFDNFNFWQFYDWHHEHSPHSPDTPTPKSPKSKTGKTKTGKSKTGKTKTGKSKTGKTKTPKSKTGKKKTGKSGKSGRRRRGIESPALDRVRRSDHSGSESGSSSGSAESGSPSGSGKSKSSKSKSPKSGKSGKTKSPKSGKSGKTKSPKSGKTKSPKSGSPQTSVHTHSPHLPNAIDGSWFHHVLCQHIITAYVELTGFSLWSHEVHILKARLYSQAFINLVNRWVLVDFVGRTIGVEVEVALCTVLNFVDATAVLDFDLITTTTGIVNFDFFFEFEFDQCNLGFNNAPMLLMDYFNSCDLADDVRATLRMALCHMTDDWPGFATTQWNFYLINNYIVSFVGAVHADLDFSFLFSSRIEHYLLQMYFVWHTGVSVEFVRYIPDFNPLTLYENGFGYLDFNLDLALQYIWRIDFDMFNSMQFRPLFMFLDWINCPRFLFYRVQYEILHSFAVEPQMTIEDYVLHVRLFLHRIQFDFDWRAHIDENIFSEQFTICLQCMFNTYQLENDDHDSESISASLLECDGEFNVALPDISLPEIDISMFVTECQQAYLDYFRGQFAAGPVLHALEVAASSVDCAMPLPAVIQYFTSFIPSDSSECGILNLDGFADVHQQSFNIIQAILGLVGGVVGGVVDGVGDVVGGIVGGVGDVVGGVAGGVGDVVGGVADGVGAVAGGVADGVGDVVGGVADGVGAVAGGVADGVGDVIDGVGDGIGAVAGGIGDAIGGIFGRRKRDLGDLVGGVVDGVGDTVGGVADGVGDVVGGVADGVGSVVDGVADGVGSVVGGVIGGIGDVGNLIGGTINGVQLTFVQRLYYRWFFELNLSWSPDHISMVQDAIMQYDNCRLIFDIPVMPVNPEPESPDTPASPESPHSPESPESTETEISPATPKSPKSTKSGKTKTGKSKTGKTKTPKSSSPGKTKSPKSKTGKSKTGKSKTGKSKTGKTKTPKSSKTKSTKGKSSKGKSSKSGSSSGSAESGSGSDRRRRRDIESPSSDRYRRSGHSDSSADSGSSSGNAVSGSGSAKSGSAKSTKSKTGKSKTGKSKTGKSKTGKSKTGKSKTGKSKTGKSKTGKSKSPKSGHSPGTTHSHTHSHYSTGKGTYRHTHSHHHTHTGKSSQGHNHPHSPSPTNEPINPIIPGSVGGSLVCDVDFHAYLIHYLSCFDFPASHIAELELSFTMPAYWMIVHRVELFMTMVNFGFPTNVLEILFQGINTVSISPLDIGGWFNTLELPMINYWFTSVNYAHFYQNTIMSIDLNIYQEVVWNFFQGFEGIAIDLEFIREAILSIGPLTPGHVVLELREFIVNFFTLNIGFISTIDFDMINVFTYSPDFSNLCLVLEFITTLEPLAISGDIDLDVFLDLDFAANIDWSLDIGSIWGSLGDIVLDIDLEMPDLSDFENLVQIDFDLDGIQLLLNNFLLDLDFADFSPDFEIILPSIQVFLQGLTFDGAVTIGAIQTALIRFMMELDVNIDVLGDFMAIFETDAFIDIVLMMEAFRLDVDISDIDLSVILATPDFSIAQSLALDFFVNLDLDFGVDVDFDFDFFISLIDFNAPDFFGQFEVILSLLNAPLEVVNQMYYILSSVEFSALLEAMEIDISLPFNIYQDIAWTFAAYYEIDISVELIRLFNFHMSIGDSFASFIDNFDLFMMDIEMSSMMPLMASFNILWRIEDICAMPDVQCPDVFALMSQISLGDLSFDLTYEEFTFDIYSSIVSSCGAPAAVIEFLLDIEIYNSIMLDLTVYAAPETTTTIATMPTMPTEVPAPTGWDCDVTGRYCVAVAAEVMTYGDAMRHCEALGGELPMPSTAGQNDLVASYGRNVWIQGYVNDILAHGSDDMGYTNWAPRQRAYVNHMTGHWHIGHASDDHNCLCVKPKEVQPADGCPNILSQHHDLFFSGTGSWTSRTDDVPGWHAIDNVDSIGAFALGTDLRYKCPGSQQNIIRITCVKMGANRQEKGFALCTNNQCSSFERVRWLNEDMMDDLASFQSPMLC